jgi:hypothetical protein
MQARISLLVVVAFVSASCSGTDAVVNPTQPSPTTSPLSVAVSTPSPFAAAQKIKNPVCPSVSPFSVPLIVVVEPPTGVSVIVTSIRAQFVDTSGAAAPQVTLPAPVPTTQFGSALEQARSGQSFPLTVGIGCGTGTTGSVRIFVETRDSQGRTGMGQTVVAIR